MRHDTGTECCLSLCQAVSFLPAAEEDEEMMMKDECQGRGQANSPGETCGPFLWTSIISNNVVGNISGLLILHPSNYLLATFS